MMTTSSVETKLNEVFVKKAPQLPDGVKKFFVTYLPILSLIIGILTLLSALTLWQWAHASNYVSQICTAYGVTDCPSTSRLSLWLWLAIIVSLVEGILYLLAYPGLRDHKKEGWNYLYYGALVNIAYAVVSLFASYDAVGHFIGALIGSALGFWILFQIRSAYLGHKTSHDASNNSPVQ